MNDTASRDQKKAAPDLRSALPVTGQSLAIRPMMPADAEAYAAGAGDDLVRRFAHLPLETYTPQIVRDLIHGVIADGLRDGNLAILTIADPASDTFLGSLVVFDITDDDAEVGYWVGPEHRGKNISGRALELALEMARRLTLHGLRARTVLDNPASQKSLLKAGFEQQGEPELQVTPSGKTAMGVHYAIRL